MYKIFIVLLIGFSGEFLFFQNSIAESVDDIQKMIITALSYSDLPPNQRNRDVAVENILAVLPKITSDDIKQKLMLRVARLYGQSFNSKLEQANYEKALEFYEKSLMVNPVYTLELISARMELADIISLNPNRSKSYELYKEVINVNPELIVKSELTDALLKQISELQPRETVSGITEDSFAHQEIIKRRIQQFSKSILSRYRTYRVVAIENFVHQTYIDFGMKGLKELLDEYKDDKEVHDIITRKIAKATVDHWDKKIHQ